MKRKVIEKEKRNEEIIDRIYTARGWKFCLRYMIQEQEQEGNRKRKTWRNDEEEKSGIGKVKKKEKKWIKKHRVWNCCPRNMTKKEKEQ